MSLLALQRDFQTWLTSESAEIAVRFGERAHAGLAVYLNNYRSQLLACLATSFPTVRAWIGDRAFDGAAATHIDSVPPQGWTLDAYALDFPQTLDSLYPRDREIAELARLERDLAVAFVGPDATPVDPAALGNIDWDSAVLHFVPTFALLRVTTNVGAIWSAINAQQNPPPSVHLPEPASIAIWRDHLVPTFRTVTAEEAAILEQARSGQRFGAICANLVECLGEERGPAIAGSMLSQWLADRLIVHISDCVDVYTPH
jgi:hypothetical protein